MKEPLFSGKVKAKDPLYTRINENNAPGYIDELKRFLEELWQHYAPYADKDFLQKFAEDTQARVWEMYLACSLLDMGLPVKAKHSSQGPDILIQFKDKRIFVEAVAPSEGAVNSPDKVPQLVPGVARQVPDEQMILRYRSSIEEKYLKYDMYLKNRIIEANDCYIIAINSAKIDAAIVEMVPPRIIRTVFPVGYL